jgi:hypothetical protein
MTDTTTTPPAADPTNLNATVKGAIAIAALIANAAVIAFAILAGDPKNSLHASALAWSYASALAILAGLGFPAALSALTRIGK